MSCKILPSCLKMTKCGTDHKLVIAYGFFAFYQQQVTRHKLLLFLCFFAPLRGYKIKRPQKGSKFTKRFKEPHAYPNKLSKFYKAVKYATYFPDFLLNQ